MGATLLPLAQVPELLAGVRLLRSLGATERERLAERATAVAATPGQTIVREGERGDRMYVIASGSLQVYAKAFDGSEAVLARLEAGQFFGEQALLAAGHPLRTASVRAIDNCRLIAITREDLLAVLDRDHELARQLRETGEAQASLRRSKLREDVLRDLGATDHYRIESFRAGEWVFRQDDCAGRVYLVLAGRARAVRESAQGDSVLAELMPGQFFGERAILNDQPRAASVQASTDLEVASIDGGWFRGAADRHPSLRKLMDSLASIYLLPQRGLLTLQSGQLNGRPTLTAVHDLPDGRRVISTHLAGMAAFTARLVGAPEATGSARFEDAEAGVLRDLHLAGDRLIEIESEGAWTGLGAALERLLDGEPLSETQLAAFEQSGDFESTTAARVLEDRALLCNCTKVTRAQVGRAVAEGCHTLAAIAARTGATLVCGGCVPLVKELLGADDWTAARCERVIALNDSVRAFCIRPLDGACKPYRPGQHLVLQARIDGHWIQRCYTLSSVFGVDETYEITVKREPGGLFSGWLFERMPSGALFRIAEPAGAYCLPAQQAADVVCLVGGIGVTPALAMARALAAAPRAFRLHVDYSAAREEDAVCRDELLDLPLRNPRISLRLRSTRREGRLGAEEVAALVQAYAGADFYLCGTAGFMRALAGHLTRAGVPAARVHIETFHAAAERPAEAAPAQAALA